MKQRTTAMTAQDVRVRAKHAHTFLAALDLVNELGTDAGITSAANVIGVLAVNASIAASDAICGLALKLRAAGDAHDEAVSLLATATVNGPKYARDLGRILAVKTDVQYSPIFLVTVQPQKSRDGRGAWSLAWMLNSRDIDDLLAWTDCRRRTEPSSVRPEPDRRTEMPGDVSRRSGMTIAWTAYS